MGFDLYGLKPSNPSNAIRPDQMDWSKKPTEKERDEYFNNVNEYETEVVGSYFRNNVWWWRPLWNFVTITCDDILTEKDVERGSYNDGHKISKTKSRRIAARLKKCDKEGVLESYETSFMEEVKKAEKHNKKIAIKMGTLRKRVKSDVGDLVPANYPQPYKRQFEKLQNAERWGGHYPFHAENVREFTKFCENSGGFEIC